jgi:hypothetical protein
VLQQCFCVNQQVLNAILLKNYQALPLIKDGPCGLPEDIDTSNENSNKLVFKMNPNPYTTSATIQFSTTGGNTLIQQIEGIGQGIKIITNRTYSAGTYNIDIHNDGLPAGVYFLRLQNNSLQNVITVMRMP